mgnify:CR=1 FL=1
MTRIFVNLPVKDLNQSKAFFTKLGYTFNPKYTNDDGACMVISEENFVMLLRKEFFQTFIKKEIADATRTAEVIVTQEMKNPAEVDALLAKALTAGASETISMNDPGMYLRGYSDLDGHLWEIAHNPYARLDDDGRHVLEKADKTRQARRLIAHIAKHHEYWNPALPLDQSLQQICRQSGPKLWLGIHLANGSPRFQP